MTKTTKKPILAYCDRVIASGLSLGPGVHALSAASLIEDHVSGTTSRPHHFAVLWIGDHSALVYWRPESGKDHVSPMVLVIRLGGTRWGAGDYSKTVHDCETGDRPGGEDRKKLWSHGRLSPKVVAALVERAKREDPLIPGQVAKKEAEDLAADRAREDEQRARENERAEEVRKREEMLRLAREISGPAYRGTIQHKLANLVLELEG